jgi:hypothetical protein
MVPEAEAEAEESGPVANYEPVVEAGPQQLQHASSSRNLGLNVLESRSVMRRYLMGILALFGLLGATIACVILAKENMEETNTEQERTSAYTTEFAVFLVLMANCLIVPICWGVDVRNCNCRRRSVTVSPTIQPMILCHPVGADEPSQMQRQSVFMQEHHQPQVGPSYQ